MTNVRVVSVCRPGTNTKRRRIFGPPAPSIGGLALIGLRVEAGDGRLEEVLRVVAEEVVDASVVALRGP